MQPISKNIEIKSGFYPSILYLPVPLSFTQEPFIELVRLVLEEGGVQYQSVAEPHISLTKTLYPLESQIGKVKTKARQLITLKKIRLPAVLLLQKLIVIDNFIAVQVAEISQQRLSEMGKQLQQLLQQPFYQQPIFHVSLFKVFSQINQNTLQKILSIAIPTQKCYSLTHLFLKAGKLVSSLN